MPQYRYRATLVRVIDGDTLKVSVRLMKATRMRSRDLGLHHYIEDGWLCQHITVRLFGIDAARGNTPDGLAARQWLEAKLNGGQVFSIDTIRDRTEKYGRWLGIVWGDRARGTSLNEQMVAASRAQPWDGTGTRPLGETDE